MVQQTSTTWELPGGATKLKVPLFVINAILIGGNGGIRTPNGKPISMLLMFSLLVYFKQVIYERNLRTICRADESS